MSIQAQGADGAGTKTVTLWCMHIAGPDDVHAAPDFWTALSWAAELNSAVAARAIKQGWSSDENWPLAQATVQRWPWSDERHADSLATELAARAGQETALASPRADSAERTAGEDWAAVLAYSILTREGYAYEHLVNAVATELRRIEAVGYSKGHEAGDAHRKAATPTPATPPGVPDSVRALSEKATAGEWSRGKAIGGLIKIDASGGPGRSFPEQNVKWFGLARFISEVDGQHHPVGEANADFAVAAVNFVRALIAAQPAGQSAGSGAEDRGKCIGCGKSLTAEEAEFLVNTCDACERAEHESRQIAEKPAPDSTRTGEEGTEVAIRRIVERLIDRHFERTSANSGAATEAAVRDLAALAAHPAAPEAQGAWLPISTAPRNDKLVMLGWWCDVGGDPRWIAVAGWYEAGPADQCWYAAYDEERVEPTHWQPLGRLPAPPAPSGQGGR